MRLIDADALSDYLYTFYECADYITVGQILNDIDEQPTIEPEQRWTPVTERLPEEYGEYLVIYKSDEGQIFMDIIEYETSYEFDHVGNDSGRVFRSYTCLPQICQIVTGRESHTEDGAGMPGIPDGRNSGCGAVHIHPDGK